MSAGAEPLVETAEDLYENAPCGYLSARPDGTVTRVNRTFEAWTGLSREDLLGKRRFQELLPAGDRIYHDTHFAPLLQMQGWVREIALELVRADGSRLPALVNATLVRDSEGAPLLIRMTVFDATDRRRYERELLRARHREHEIARRLQRSMMSGEPPRARGLELGIVYRPGVSGLEIGGDWHDAFWLEPERRIVMFVGDVVGRGIEAAATMGQLRSAGRALAATCDGPGEVLDELDRYTTRHGVGQLTSVVCVELELDSGRARYACAGHPPPVLLAGDGPARFLDEGRSPLLDSGIDDVSPRAEASLTLSPGSVLVLYTDGLTDRRVAASGAAHPLLDAAEAHRDAGAPALAEGVLRLLGEPEQADDICLLVARLR